MMEKLQKILMAAGGIMVIAGAMLHVTGTGFSAYLYCIGAALFAAIQFTDRYDGENRTIRRLRSQQVLGAVFLMISGLVMMAEKMHPDIVMNREMNSTLHAVLIALTARNSWIMFMCLAAVFELYSSFRLSREEEKEESENIG